MGLLEEAVGGVYDKIDIGEDGSPQGVDGGGRVATGLNGGDGREPSPVPPMMAICTGSSYVLGSSAAISAGAFPNRGRILKPR